MLECKPPHRFVHTHRLAQYDDPVCQAAYGLKEVPDDVQVTLHVTGIAEGSKTAKDRVSSGKMIVNAVRAICETGTPGVGTRLMYAMFKHMEFVLPARMISQYWPL